MFSKNHMHLCIILEMLYTYIVYVHTWLPVHIVILDNVCLRHQCPPGSVCKVCPQTNLPYCEYSCKYDNGGCGGIECTEVDIPTCNPGQCCSPVNVTCEGMYTCSM